MGRRRSKRKAETKKKREPLDKQFNCPFYNHEKSREVTMWVVLYTECYYSQQKQFPFSQASNLFFAPVSDQIISSYFRINKTWNETKLRRNFVVESLTNLHTLYFKLTLKKCKRKKKRKGKEKKDRKIER